MNIILFGVIHEILHYDVFAFTWGTIFSRLPKINVSWGGGAEYWNVSHIFHKVA